MAVSRERVVQNAEKYVSRGKIDSAIKEYRKLLAVNPNDISTLNRVGDLYARTDRNREAIDLFNQIAEVYADDGFFVKAIAIYKKIIKLDPTLLDVYEKLADLYHRQGLVNEARTQYQVLADYYLKHDRTAAAIGIYRRMAELEPDDPSHHVKLADLYQEDGQVEEAMGEYRAIADLMLQHDRGNEAARVFARALDIDSEDIGFITDAVLKLKEAGHVAAGAHFLALAVERNPKAEKVAKIAGLPDRSEAEEEAAPGEAGPSEAEEATAAEEPAAEAAPPDAGSPGFELVEEDPSTAPVGLAGDDLPALEEPGVSGEPGGSAFELDLIEGDDERPESLVTPPADMLEDAGRRGAAWGDVEAEEGPETQVPEMQAPDAAVAAEEEAEVPGDEAGTGTFEFELDLEADGAELLEATGGEGATAVEAEALVAQAEGPAADAEEPELDHDLLERTAAEVEPDRSEEAEDLLTEAEVLARYGIEEKALERLAELLHRDPENLAGYRLMVGIHLDAGRHPRAAAVAGQLAEVAERLGDEEVWPEIRERLEAAGYAVEPGRIEPPAPAPGSPETPVEVTEGPEAEPEAELEIEGVGFAADDVGAVETAAEELDLPADQAPGAGEFDLQMDDAGFELPEVELGAEVAEHEVAEPAPEEAAAREPSEPPAEAPPDEKPGRRRKREDVESALAELAGKFLGRRPRKARPEPAAGAEAPEVSPPPPVEPPVQPPPAAASAAPSPTADAPAGGVDPLRALGDSLREEIDRSGAETGAAAGAGDGDSLDDTGMSWLDEAASARDEAGGLADEADFFDLGAELDQELSAEEEVGGDELVMAPAEQSLEEIVEGFKRGVAENLSPEDFDTHFNLGIAYREMGLLDEAIGEFQVAAREPSYLVSCSSMLGLCFREKGLPELAVKWYRRGLEAPDITDDDRAGLLYDLGEAQVAAGDRMAAYHTFVDLYGIDTSYRDVVARLAELEPAR